MKNVLHIVLLALSVAVVTACGKTSTSNNRSSAAPAAQNDAASSGPLTINIAGAIALAVVQPTVNVQGSGASLLDNSMTGTDAAASNPCQTTLMTMNSDGSFSNAFDTCEPGVIVTHVEVHNGTTFLLFSTYATLPTTTPVLNDDGTSTTDPSCLLAYANSDGLVQCLDQASSQFVLVNNNVLQEDGHGNGYYVGSNYSTGVPHIWKVDLSTMAATDIFDQSTNITSFDVQSNGDIYYTNLMVQDLSVLKSGASTPLPLPDTSGNVLFPEWVSTFPDGGVYTESAAGLSEIVNYTPQAAESGTIIATVSTFDNNVYTSAAKQVFSLSQVADCTNVGGTGCISVTQFYPTFAQHALTTLDQPFSQDAPAISAQSGNTFVVAGKKVDGTPKLVAYDAQAQKEIDLLPTQGITVSNVAINGSTVYFSGTNGSNGSSLALTGSSSTVTGTVDLQSLSVSMNATSAPVTQVVPMQ